MRFDAAKAPHRGGRVAALAMVDIRNVFSDNRMLSAADSSVLLAFTACASRFCDCGVIFPHHRSDLLQNAGSPVLTVKGDVSRLRKQFRVFSLLGLRWRP